MLVSLNSLSIDQLESLRSLLNILLLLATAAVFIGVYFEREKAPADVREYGWSVVVRGLAAELACVALLWPLDIEIGNRHKAEILALNAEIAPRRLTKEQQAAIAQELLPFSGKKAMIASYILDAEGAVLGFQIRDSLKNAHLSVNDSSLMSITVGGSIDLGVHVTGKDTALVGALRTAIGKFQMVEVHDPFERGFASFGSPPALNENPDAIIFVGVKPIAE